MEKAHANASEGLDAVSTNCDSDVVFLIPVTGRSVGNLSVFAQLLENRTPL